MLKLEVDALLHSWLIGLKYVFYSKNWFSGDFIVLERIHEDLFRTCKNSTSDMGDFTESEVKKLVSMDIFVHLPFEGPSQDFHEKRAEFCNCGANATNNKDCHSHWCRKYKR